ncbi:MAG: hypothetical protein E7211_09030 [Clostridium lundense]|nr:hypothetical protein [Clostridium lundense]
MGIIVYINQIPIESDENMKSFDNNKLNAENIALIDTAVALKEKIGGTVTVIAILQSKFQFLLREALARGCDNAILIEDITSRDERIWPISLLISAEIQRTDFHIIITGYRTLDGISSYIGPQIAERLNIPQISYVKEIEIEKDKIIAKRQIEDKVQLIEVPTPCLLTMLNTQESSRSMSVKAINKAFEKEIKLWSYEDIRSYLNSLDYSAIMPHIKIREKKYRQSEKKCKMYNLIPSEDDVHIIEQNLTTIEDAIEIIIDKFKEKSII